MRTHTVVSGSVGGGKKKVKKKVQDLAVPFVITKAAVNSYVLAVRELCCDFDAVAAFAVREDACYAVELVELMRFG
jgi:hypothetical protein